MFTRKELEKRIAKRTEEVAEAERRRIDADKELASAKAYLQALIDMRKLCPAERSSEEKASDSLREGSLMAKARDAIKAAGKPLHIADLMKAIGVEIKPQKKTSLAGSLSAYARKAKIFTRPAANTFGLIELEEADPPEEMQTQKEVPRNVVSL
jgi:hypothetical protein